MQFWLFFSKPKSSTVQDSGDKPRYIQTKEEVCCHYLKIPLKSKKVFALTSGKVYNSMEIANSRQGILPALHQLNWWCPEKIIWKKTYFFHYICQSHRQLLPQKHKWGLFTSIHRSWNQRVGRAVSGGHKAGRNTEGVIWQVVASPYDRARKRRQGTRYPEWPSNSYPSNHTVQQQWGYFLISITHISHLRTKTT